MAYQRGVDPKYSAAIRVGLSTALRDELAATEPAPQSLMRLLEQLDGRVRADMEGERLYVAFDRAAEELIRLGRA